MKPNKLLLFILLMLLFRLPANAQEDRFVRDLVENLAEGLPDEVDLIEFTERLSLYRTNPLDLNVATEKQLKELCFLSPLQISSLLAHIKANGKLIDVLELQGVNGFDLVTIERMEKFTKAGPPSPLSQLDRRKLADMGQHDLMLRYGQLLHTQKGFRELPGSRYLGSKDKLLLRYRYAFRKTLTAGLLMEKDAGEYLSNSKTPSDHLSANIALNDVGSIKRLVLGDYSLQFGQGLTLWSGFSFGKGADGTSIAARDLGLRPYSSANEASFFRGIAGTFDVGKHLLLTPFLSARKRDASLKMQTDSSYSLQTINISGLHRTQTELNNEKSISESVWGAVLQYSWSQINLGLVGYTTRYDHSFITGSSLYNRYSFTGTSLFNTGFHYSITYKNLYGYGEIAKSTGAGMAMVNGLLISISPKLSAALLHRDYQKDYHNFFSSGIGENTEIANEKGFYAGLSFSPSTRLNYSFYLDTFKFPWLKYRVDEPSGGHEALFQLAYSPKKTLKLVFRLKEEQKSQNPDAADTIPGLKEVLKQGLRLGCDWKLSSNFSIQQRLELAGYKKGSALYETGKLFYTDVNFKRSGFKVSGNMRLAFFSAPSYNSRIYAYEDDVLYASTSGLYFNRGVRSYFNLRFQMNRSLNFWARYAAYIYHDQQVTGSGLDEINGNIKSDVKFQLRYQF